MEPTIKCGKHLALHAKLTGSRFEDVCLGEAEFDNVSLARARIHNVNMSDMMIDCVQIGGTTFRHVGLPPDQRKINKQRPLVFDDCDFTGSTFTDCDLYGINLNNCNLDGARIDGVLVSELIKSHRESSQQ